ncbi:MAG TPA: YtxH domain-containing protein [Gemmatimonadales bacterium]
MSDRGSGGFGSFLLGIAVGAVVGMLFAPEAGEGTRRKLSRRLRDLKDLADEKTDDVRRLLEAAGEGDERDDETETGEDETEPRSTREELERRLAAARRRRRNRPAKSAGADEVEEEDEPVA